MGLPAIPPGAPGVSVSRSMKLRRPANSCVLIGDSNSSFMWVTSSTQVQIVARSPMCFASQMLNKRLEVFSNQGLPGSTSSDWQPEVTAAIASGCQYAILAGPTNDLTGGSSPYTLTIIPYATTIANLKNWIAQLLGAGIAVILTPIPPQGSLSVSAATQWSLTNNWMKEYARSNPVGVTFIDIAGTNLDPQSAANSFLSGRFQDTKHYAGIGAFYAGKAIYTALNSILPPLDLLACSPGNATGVVGSGSANSAPVDVNQLLGNPLMTTNNGAGTGAGSGVFASTAWAATTVVAAGVYNKNGGNLYYTAAGGTTGSTPPTHTSGTVSDGGVLWTYKGVNTVASNWQVLISGTAPNITGDCWVEKSDSNDQYQWQCVAIRNAGAGPQSARIICNPSSKFTDGDIVYADCEFDLQSVSQTVDALTLTMTLIGSPNLVVDDGTENTANSIPEAYRGTLRTRRVAQPTGTTGITHQVINTLSAGANTILRVRRAQVRRVIST